MGPKPSSSRSDGRGRTLHVVVDPNDPGIEYHPTTHECLAIPPHLRMPGRFQEIVDRLDAPMADYTLPETDIPVMVYQFLSAWTKFSPSMYNGEYFQYRDDTRTWAIDQEMKAFVQTGVAMLQGVIMDSIRLIGEERRPFFVDRNYNLSEKLWMAVSLEELRTADKLLKLRVEVTFARLAKLKNLHHGMLLSTPMGSLASLPSSPDLSKRLKAQWEDKRLPLHRVARWADKIGWESLQREIEGGQEVQYSKHHPFAGTYATKLDALDAEIADSLKLQSLPRIDAEPYGLGLYLAEDANAAGASERREAGGRSPRKGPGSILDMSTMPTPPTEPSPTLSAARY